MKEWTLKRKQLKFRQEYEGKGNVALCILVLFLLGHILECPPLVKKYRRFLQINGFSENSYLSVSTGVCPFPKQDLKLNCKTPAVILMLPMTQESHYRRYLYCLVYDKRKQKRWLPHTGGRVATSAIISSAPLYM